MSHDHLARLHRRLVEAVRRAAPESLARPLTIADVYQHLVPYRSVRGELGFADLQEYEHTLLRLFAGERDYLRVDVPQVADEFKRELRSSNPILGIYRDYAAVGLALNPALASGAAEPSEFEKVRPSSGADNDDVTLAGPTRTGPAEAGRSAATAPTPPSAPAPTTAPPPGEPASAIIGADPGAPARRERDEAPSKPAVPATEELEKRSVCWHCRERLPEKREVRFCPHCGTVQVPTPCEECGTPIEPSWKFCALCGSPRAPLPMMSSA
jgi:hypothetical protein